MYQIMIVVTIKMNLKWRLGLVLVSQPLPRDAKLSSSLLSLIIVLITAHFSFMPTGNVPIFVAIQLLMCLEMASGQSGWVS